MATRTGVATVVVGVRLSPRQALELDELRGGLSRSGYLRMLLHAATLNREQVVPAEPAEVVLMRRATDQEP